MRLRAAATLVAMAALAVPAPLAAPKLAPLDEAGYQKLLAANKGSIVIVDFWATWCAPCRVELPLLVKLESRYRARGVKLLTISADEPEAEEGAVEFLKQAGVTGPAYIKRAKDDDKFINSVDAKWSGALPALFVYDRLGRKVQSFIGETEMADLEALLAKILK